MTEVGAGVPDGMPSAQDELLAYRRIEDVIHRYARGADRLDAALFASAFWDDGGYEVSGEIRPVGVNVTAILDDTMAAKFAMTHHLVGNVLVDFHGSDRANSESYFHAFHLTHDGLSADELRAMIGDRRFAELAARGAQRYEIVIGGRYLDALERRGDEWRIRARRIVIDWMSIRPDSGLQEHEPFLGERSRWGGRDRSDPSYR